ncbi:MAG: PAS domain-containing protein [Thauera sp.]|jgi:PAS domain S-box-containing protein
MNTDAIPTAASLIVLIFDDNGDLVDLSPHAASVLGPLAGRRVELVADATSAQALRDLALSLAPGADPYPCMLVLLGRDGTSIPVAAQVDWVSAGPAPRQLRVIAIPAPGLQRWIEHLVQSEALLKSFAQLSSEAMWCIEFSEPVDLALCDDEIVRQVFENDCHWRLCNESMARIYNLPPGLDFNKQPVSQYFPRNPENEAFVRQIIESNFAVDGILSIDTRHDGASIYIENTVRTHIVDGALLRLWGTVRDITEYRKAHNRLIEAAQDVSSILCSVPDPIVVVNRGRHVVALNPAFETLSGWNSQQLLGHDIQPIMDLETPLPGGRRWYGIDRQRWIAEIKAASGQSITCDVHSAPIGDEAPERFVLTLRPTRTAPA